MCGIIAVLRRPSSREVPELVELLGLLESVSNSLSLDDLNMLKKHVESLVFVRFLQFVLARWLMHAGVD